MQLDDKLSPVPQQMDTQVSYHRHYEALASINWLIPMENRERHYSDDKKADL
jgi:flagellar biosynthesis regulator FlbT